MKKITLLITLLITSLGFSQTVIENFDGTAPTLNVADGASTSISATQAVSAPNSLQIISSSAGQPWQQADLTFQENIIDLRTTKTATVQVYSTTSFTMLAKVVGGVDADGTGAGPDSATSDSHTGSGWEELTFDFSVAEDGTQAANDAYSRILFLPNWAGNNTGNNATNNNWNDPVDGTYYVDDITAMSIPRPATCSDGIQNGDETDVDCGGSSCDACDPLPSSESPDPTNGTGVMDADVLSVFNDAGDFTNVYGTDFAFGEEFRSIIDIDAGSGVNEIVKLELDRGGWGAGNNTEVDIITAGFTHFNFSYYMPTLTAGTEGHLLQATLVSRTPGGAQDADAVFNINETGTGNGLLEFDKWVNVSIPLTDFTNFNSHLLLFKFGTPSTAFSPLVYLDNVFFSKSAVTLSTNNESLIESSVFPNPSSNGWNFNTPNTIIKSVEVYNLLGKRVASQKANSNSVTISTDGLASGVYLAKINTELGTKTVKLLRD